MEEIDLDAPIHPKYDYFVKKKLFHQTCEIMSPNQQGIFWGRIDWGSTATIIGFFSSSFPADKKV